MPDLIFNNDEIIDHKQSKVNSSGYAYIGRKYTGKLIDWIKRKEG